MSILSFAYFCLVLVLLFLYYLCPRKVRWIVLLLGSVVFYFLSSGFLIFYLFFGSVVIYCLGRQLDKEKENGDKLKVINNKEITKEDIKKISKIRQKRLVLFGVLLLLFCIVLTKYSGFILENINAVFKFFSIKSLTIKKIAVPLGISYYTLEAISYLVDIYRGKINAEKNFLKVFLYLIYFPKIVEGPITRFKEFSEKAYGEIKLNFNNILIGIDLIIYGLFKKMVIADRAGIFVNNVFDGNFGGLPSILVIILYTVQIYAEFSGCIDIVRGVSQLFGIALPLNFKRPFFSKSVQEFWQRWHITLGSWIREYVFFPVSLSKLNIKVGRFCKEKWSGYWSKFVSIAFPLLFVWLVNGIWHGASYKYVIYGMYYYVVMMIGVLLKPWLDKIMKKVKVNELVLKLLQIFRTWIFVMIGMALFRSDSIKQFGSLLASIFKTGQNVIDFGLVWADFIILIGAVLIVLMVSILEENKKISLEEGISKSSFKRGLIYAIFLLFIILFGIYGSGYDASSFIYGAF